LTKPYDSTTKQLVEGHPVDWLAFVGLPISQSVRIVDADLSSFSLAADKVVLVEGILPYIAHFEFQSGYDPDLDRRMLLYNAVLRWRHGLPVRTIVVLLRPAAMGPGVTGQVSDTTWSDNELRFGYKLIRIWEIPAQALLAGGLGTLPLAPIGAVTEQELPTVVNRLEERLWREAPAQAAELETATYILMGLRYPDELAGQLLKGARQMKDSVTYQAIVKEGKAEGKADGERAALVRIGSKRLGPPTSEILATLEAIADAQTLERMIDRSLDAKTWDEIVTG
jgi:predicted transposase YdaD